MPCQLHLQPLPVNSNMPMRLNTLDTKHHFCVRNINYKKVVSHRVVPITTIILETYLVHCMVQSLNTKNKNTLKYSIHMPLLSTIWASTKLWVAPLFTNTKTCYPYTVPLILKVR